jgi:hypothetical protein
MTLPQFLEMECPRCHAQQPATVYRTINVTIDADLKQAVLDGEINIFHCGACAFEAPIEADLLYHDMDQEFWVQYYPFAWIEKRGLLERFAPEGEWKMCPAPGRSGYTARPPHLVFDMNELVRYVLFRDRISERERGARPAAQEPGA